MPIPGAPPPPLAVAGLVSDLPAIVLTGGDGTVWPLTNVEAFNVRLLWGMTGLDAPPVSLFTSAAPASAGAQYQGAHDDVRPVFLPIYVAGDDRPAAMAYRRALVASINPNNGYSQLSMQEADGGKRVLNLLYASGAEGIETQDNAGLYWTIYGLNFLAPDPYWYGDAVFLPPWIAPAPRNFFPLGAFPITLSPSQVLGGTIVTNVGDVDSWPVWTLNGPASSLTISLNGGGSFTLNFGTPLTSSDVRVINTDPAADTVADGTGANKFAEVAAGYEFWPLPKGTSSASLTVGGSGTATKLAVSYQPRYLMH